MAHGRLSNRLTPVELDVFDNSLERCVAKPEFMERFYEIFIGSSEEVREKFRTTDLRRQAKMVKASLYLLLLATQGLPEGDVHFDRIAKLHGKGQLDIRPELYDQWLNSLVQAVQEHDPNWRPETERVWRAVMGLGIEIMVEQATKRSPVTAGDTVRSD